MMVGRPLKGSDRGLPGTGKLSSGAKCPIGKRKRELPKPWGFDWKKNHAKTEKGRGKRSEEILNQSNFCTFKGGGWGHLLLLVANPMKESHGDFSGARKKTTINCKIANQQGKTFSMT